jgi:hypothetical protein
LIEPYLTNQESRQYLCKRGKSQTPDGS